MTEDARFDDAGGKPLRLIAQDAEDLQVLSALVQDAVFPASEMRWDRRGRRFALLLNRFRWEEGGRTAERVQSLLWIDGVRAVQSQGVTAGDADTVLSLLEIGFEPGEAPGGRVILTLAGDGAIACEVEALETVLKDVTRPYAAPSGKVPSHD